MNKFPKTFQKVVAGIVLVSLLSFIAFGVLLPVKPAHAQVSTDPPQIAVMLANWVNQLKDGLAENVLALAYKNLVGYFLQKVAYDAASFIASGGEGQDSLVYKEGAGEYFKNVGDAAAGAGINAFAQGLGFAEGFCSPPDDLLQMDIALGLQTQFGGASPPTVACTLSKMGSNWQEKFSDPEFGTFINMYWDPQANNLGSALSASSRILQDIGEEEEAAKWERMYSGGEFKAKTELVTGWVQTPGSMVEEELKQPLNADENVWGQYTGSILADTAGIFLNTLTSKLMDRFKDGMFNTVSGSTLADLMAGSTGGSVGGVSAAEAVYSDLKKPSFIATGVYNVMNDMVVCPDSDPEVYNCVLGSSMQSAIDNQWTVQEYINYLNENGATFKFAQDDIGSPEEGLTPRAITILKKFRVVPVGWQIAAEYINSEVRLEGNSEYTLNDLVELYDNCGPAEEDYSAFCKLIDPNWVLKAPENYCAKESYTQDIVYEDFSDNDGSQYTMEERSLSRSSACVDERACIKENADGSCSAYGFCSEEKRVYGLAGDICNEEDSSCQYFNDEDGETVSYLKNTINQDECATSPGCDWYCNYSDDLGNFMCLDQDRGYVACVEGGAGYVEERFCTCEDTPTCEVETSASCDTGINPDCDNSCTYTGDDNTVTTCSLDDNCGANYPTFNPNTGTCTCTLGSDCEVNEGGTTCSNDLGNTCDLAPLGFGSCSEDDSNFGTREYCECTVNNETCNVSMNNYTCDTASEGACILGEELQAPDLSQPSNGSDPYLVDPQAPDFWADIAVNFDNDVQSCDEDDASCHLYYRMQPGNNLVFNANFTPTSGSNEDTTQDNFGACSNNGQSCSSDTQCASNFCQGWDNPDGIETLALASGQSAATPGYGDSVMRIGSAGLGTLLNTMDTGKSLDNRTFTFSVSAYTEESGCSLTHRLVAGGDSFEQTDELINGFANTLTQTITLDPNNYGQDLTIEIDNPSCIVYLDVAQLEESDTASALSLYGAGGETYLLKDNLIECALDDVGCELYTPDRGDEEDAIPAVITNPNQAACQPDNVYGIYQNPACSQCLSSTVGCDFYQEQATVGKIPLNHFITGLNETAKEGIRTRTGYYCQNDQTQSCDPTDATDPCAGTCLPDVSIIPDSGQSCAASQVGCEEYTNLDAVDLGGEGLEYYSFLRQCVKTDDADIDTFYTWVGSDVAGYQLRSFSLKKSNADNGPCTNLDLSSEVYNAACVDGVGNYTVNDCTAEFGNDPDCRQYYNDNGEIYYRYETETIPVSEECKPFRSTTDGRTYYALTSASTSCSEANNGCREYKGTDAGNVEKLIDATFATNTTLGWDGAESTSSEAIVQGDYSLVLTSGGGANTIEYLFDEGDLSAGTSYVLTFWAQGDGKLSASIKGADQDYYFSPDGPANQDSASPVYLGGDGEWRYYQLGPVVLNEDITFSGAEYFELDYNDGSTGYIDNIEVSVSTSQYLIKGTASICPGYEGCKEYEDRAGDAHYLKSFLHLCEDQYVGCELLVDSYNSSSPYTQMWQTDNEYNLDDTIIPHDLPKPLVYDEEQFCFAEAKGCTRLGVPEIDYQSEVVNGFNETYLINDPDNYSQLLCQEHQLQCEAFTNEFDGTLYFKDPGNKTCEWTTGSNGNYDWYKSGTDELCPTKHDYDYPSYPIGSVCNSNSGTRVGKYCTADSDCEPTDGSATGQFPPRCISSPSEDENPGNLPTQDFGWVGTCSEDASGCTTYLDASSPNVAELVTNYNFESDVRNNETNTFYDVPENDPSYDSVRDHEPDFWETEGASCTTFTQSDTDFYNDKNSVEIRECNVIQNGSATITVSRDELYVLSGYFMGNENNNFGFGLRYYDSNLNEITVAAEDNYIAAYNAGFTADQVDAWVRYSAKIGPGSTIEFPEGAAYVNVIFYDDSGTALNVDDVSFKEADEYFYIDYTVDGTQEYATLGKSASCTNVSDDEAAIDSDGGCIGFQDFGYYTLNQYSNGSSCNECIESINNSTCNAEADACNSNTVIKVTPNRICDEWIACRTARVVDNPDGTSEYTCFSIDQCTGMDSDGRCNEWKTKPAYEEIGTETDLTYESSAADNRDLDLIQNLTGYVRAGLSYPDLLMCRGGINDGDICSESGGECQDQGACVANIAPAENPNAQALGPSICQGGSHAGESCNSNADCSGSYHGVCTTGLIIEGYYPYGWMPETGQSGGDTNQDLIEDGDFEGLHCEGNDADKNLSCLNDNQCILAKWNASEDADGNISFETYETQYGTTPDYDCPNDSTDSNWPFETWSAYGNSYMEIAHYDAKYNPPDNPNININNVLSIHPIPSTFTSGVETEPDGQIQPGGSYSMSMKARLTTAPGEGDTLNIAFRHEGDETTKDYFLNGLGMVDVVFLVDNATDRASVSMETAIDSLTGYLSGGSFSQIFTDSGVDAQYAVVNIGGNELEAMQGDVPICGDFPDNNSLEQDLTYDMGAVTDAMNTIRNQAKKICTDEEAAIYQALSSSLNGATSGIDFRHNAQKAFILVTNSIPGFGNAFDPADALEALVNSATPLYVLTLNEDVDPVAPVQQLVLNPVDVYSYLAEPSGGYIMTPITDATQLDGVADSILSQITPFQLTTQMQTYTFGPITVDEKAEATDTTYLEIISSGGKTMQIDDVSLLPTLEVNKNLDTIARSCRAYPSEKAPRCSYEEESGEIFRGWNGYCLEVDPEDTSRCITWWPVDTIAGEADVFAKEPAGYDGRSSVFQCLVAKGYEEVGFCADSGSIFDSATSQGQGVQCSSDDQCSSGEYCFEGSLYDVNDLNGQLDVVTTEDPNGPDDTQNYYAYTRNIQTLDPQISHPHNPWVTHGCTTCGSIGALGSCVGPVNLPTQYFFNGPLLNPWNIADSTCTNSLLTPGEVSVNKGVIVRMQANAIERNINISEIEKIVLDTGEAPEGVLKSQDEALFWGQKLPDPDDDYWQLAGTAPISNLDRGQPHSTLGYRTSSNETDYMCETIDEQETPGIGCFRWGRPFKDTAEPGTDDYYDLVYVYSYSNFDVALDAVEWGDENLDCLNNSQEGEEEFRFGTMAANGPGTSWFKSPCVDKQIKTAQGANYGIVNGHDMDFSDLDWNPFQNITSSTINNDIIDNANNANAGTQEYAYFDINDVNTDYFGYMAHQNHPAPAWSGSAPFGSYQDGGNVYAVWLDFNAEGYLNNIYYMIWYGANETQDNALGIATTSYDNPMQLRYYLREPCAVVGETVSDEKDNNAWAERASNGGGTNPTGVDYTITTNYEPWSSIVPNTETNPANWDSYEDTDPDTGREYDITKLGPNPAFVETGTKPDGEELWNAGSPYACIGECGNRFCNDSDTECTDTGPGASDCSICVGPEDPNGDVSETGLSAGEDFADYNEQLNYTLERSVNRLKHVFADLVGGQGRMWAFAPQYNNLSAAYLIASDTNEITDYFADEYDGMNECPGNERPDAPNGGEAEYCGVRPTIEEIAIDGITQATSYEIDSGQMVELTFDSHVDQEQLPLENIFINWGDGGAPINDFWGSAAGSHRYDHAYSCTAESEIAAEGQGAQTLGDGVCQFQISITLIDNWDWCSGVDFDDGDARLNTDGDDLNNDGEVNEQEDCGSYDIVPFQIIVPQ
ncbi:hypothetical protein KKF29_03940 [Patescibacteria group bacterium]|nr:hypothetical protein [Patescibacteria group bacterium]